MFAVQYHRYGGSEVLAVEEVEEPHAGPGRVRIAVRATGVTPADWYLRSGMLQDFASWTSPIYQAWMPRASSTRWGRG